MNLQYEKKVKRGCGYRKAGGLYLVSGAGGMDCHRLPMELHVCPACSAGFKYSRGFTWIDPYKLFGCVCDISGVKADCHEFKCPVCFPPMERHGLMWIGKKFYTTSSFSKEANEMGISKRISAIPRGFKVGETWIYLAHLEACIKRADGEEPIQMTLDGSSSEPLQRIPGVFSLFKPSHIEKMVTDTESRNEKEMQDLIDRGITPIIVPDGDKDHAGSVHDKIEEELGG